MPSQTRTRTRPRPRTRPRTRLVAIASTTAATIALLPMTHSAEAQLAPPEWVQSRHLGNSLSSGLYGFVADSAGNTYTAGTGGTSGNTDVHVAAHDTNGNLLWSDVYNGPGNWHDQARGIALSPDESILWVCGNTPDAGKRAEALLLKYDAVTGDLLDSTIVTSQYSEHLQSIATDAQGNVYATGGTGGDGSDVMTMKFDSNGVEQWRMTWDGDAWGPYSQDHGQKMLIAPDGHPVIQVHGISADLQPDYYAIKYDATTGAEMWVGRWGTRGGDYVSDTVIDANGDVYQTGVGIDFTNKYSTVKYNGDNGVVIWQKYDSVEIDDVAFTLTLDGKGGVYVTGVADPDGDLSNYNDNIYTVKRATDDGAFLWDHVYGEDCKRCFDTPSDIVVDSAGNVILVGSTTSPPYENGATIMFLLDQHTGAENDRLVLEPGTQNYTGAGAIRFDRDENFYMASGTYDANTGDIGYRIAKFISLIDELYRLDVTNLIAGQNAMFTITDGTSNTLQYIAYSLRGFGSTFVPQVNVTLDLKSPKLLTTGRADGNGTFEKNIAIPAGAQGKTVYFQGAEQGRTTNAFNEIVQ